MRTLRLSLLTPSLFAFLACGGAPEPCATGDCAEAPADAGANPIDDPADDGADAGPPALVPVGASEHDLGGGWIGAGQPSEARLREVVEAGARVISLRYPEEDPFNEEAVVDELGGVFIRYPTQGSSYQDVSFRQGMYDLYDAQAAEGGLVYLHCASSNRVGASWALYQAERKGVPAEEAIALGKQAGLASLESMVRDILGVP